jgi:hypothetical protein
MGLSQAAEAAAAHRVSDLEQVAAASDLRAAQLHHRSIASAAAYSAGKVGDPKRDRRRKALQFMQFLGMNAHDDKDLIWIAEEAANSPLPPHWEQLENEFGEEYFYNTRTEQCLTTHPLEQHYKALYLKHKFPESNHFAQQPKAPDIAALLTKADELLPPALRSSLDITNAAAQSTGLEEETAVSSAKNMMSLAAAARDGVAAYVAPSSRTVFL